MRGFLPSLAGLALAACLTSETPSPVTGEWGGVHLGLVADGAGAQLEYDCATGTISGALVMDDRGRFSVGGIHFPGHGGPIREDEPTVSRPARFDGQVRGNRMTLAVTLTDTNELLGTFDLIQGASPHVFKCL